jgi:hypothetical protein
MAFDGERASSTLAVFAEDFSFGSLASIEHGQPEWQTEYDGMMDKLKGKLHRLGKNQFTTFNTSTELEWGGTKVPAGSYIVGLHCDKDGKFSLALMDATKAMKAGLQPFTPQTWTPDLNVPLTFNKGVAQEPVNKLTMTFKADDKTPAKGEFKLAWGKHTLTAPATMKVQAVTTPAAPPKK